MQHKKILPYTHVFIKLLKGPVEYVDKNIWEDLQTYKVELTDFLQQLGLTMILREEDGYAYLKHMLNDEQTAEVSWFQRRPFTYEESIMLILLRELMAEFEISESSSRELIKKRRELKEYAELFFKENASRAKFLKDIDKLIDKVEENGFLALVEGHDVADEQKFRIKKLIKDKVDIDTVASFNNQLQEYKHKQQSSLL